MRVAYILFLLFNGCYAMIDVEWNKHIIKMIEKDELTPPLVARSLSILYKSMLESYLETAKMTNNELYREYAVNGAAQEVVKELFPKHNITVRYPIDDFKSYKMYKGYYNIGVKRAKTVLNGRSGDIVLMNSSEYDNKKVIGRWYMNGTLPLLPKFGELKPVIIKSVKKYLMSSPPNVNDYYLRKSYQETFRLGEKNSKYRTDDQTESALFWEAGKGTCTPPGVWNLIAQKMVETEHNLLDRLYVFSTLNDALFDTAISVWHNKYYYNTWRPNSVFNKTGAFWEPLLKTPPFPEYGSGHSAFSGAGSEVLTSFFGKKEFSLTLKNVTRNFNSFYDAAYEAGRSRIYGGIHFEFSNIPFINMGMGVAREVIKEFKS